MQDIAFLSNILLKSYVNNAKSLNYVFLKLFKNYLKIITYGVKMRI